MYQAFLITIINFFWNMHECDIIAWDVFGGKNCALYSEKYELHLR